MSRKMVFFFLLIVFYYFQGNTSLKAQERDFEPQLGDILTPSDGHDLSGRPNLEREAQSLFRFQGYFKHLIEGIRDATGSSKMLWVSQNHLELGVLYSHGPWKIQSIVRQSFYFSNDPGDSLFRLSWHNPERNRIIPDIYDYFGKDHAYQASFSRIYAAYQSETIFFGLGRQLVSWGEGRFLNPLNLLSPSRVFVRDLEDIPGTDMAYFQYFIDATSFFELVIVPYQRENQKNPGNLKVEDCHFLLRGTSSLKNWDLMVVSGRHFHSTLFGMEANLGLWEASWRFSYVIRYNDQEKDWVTEPGFSTIQAAYWQHQGVLGVSYAFFGGKLRSNLEVFFSSRTLKNDQYLKASLEAESLIKSGLANPYPEDPTFFATSGRVLTFANYLLEGSLGYDLTSFITLEVFGLLDPEGKSALLSPSLTYEVTDSTRWITCAYFPFHKGETEGEFNAVETRFFSFLKWYF